MGETEGTQGIHETAKPRTEPMGEKTTGATSMFDKEGAIGKQFTSEFLDMRLLFEPSSILAIGGGAIGGTAQAVGGPFDEKGAIGSKFTEKGSIGGAVQEQLASSENNVLDKSK